MRGARWVHPDEITWTVRCLAWTSVGAEMHSQLQACPAPKCFALPQCCQVAASALGYKDSIATLWLAVSKSITFVVNTTYLRILGIVYAPDSSIPSTN